MSLSYILSFLRSQLLISLPVPQSRFDDEIVIVTGSNTGLGLEAARHITRLGASRVILAVRNTEKGERAKASIEESTSRTGVVDVWQVDLTSHKSVQDFAHRARQLPRLDVVVANAGLMVDQWQIAEEDEVTVKTNVVSTFLMGLLMLPKLQETATRYNVRPRLVVVASDVHFLTDLPERKAESIFDELRDERKANMRNRYNVTKLMQVFGVRELAAQIDQSKKPKVTVNCLTPGFCYSEFGRDMSVFAQYFLSTMRFLLARSTEVGSRTLVAAAAAEVGEKSHGEYMADSQVSNVSPFVTSAEGAATQQRIWSELKEKLEQIQPGLTQNI
ncbi:MAG: hypothetical protein Q9207_001439 [Kuettlingeria erythrocarpa]